jgi:thiol:disulfide interchange protein DsbD
MSLQPLKILVLLMVLVVPSWADDEFLDPEDAFRFSASLVSPGMFEVRYVIADGYYMYLDRFRFDVEPRGIVLGTPRFPAGQWHEDEFFGRSQVFRGQVIIGIPIVSGADVSGTIRLIAVSQGCADAGICYLPTEQTKDFELIGSLGAPSPTR